MKRKSIFTQINSLHEENLAPKLEAFVAANGGTLEEGQANSVSVKEAREQMNFTENYLHAQMTGRNLNGEEMDVDLLNLNEALTTSDVSIVFPRVISTILNTPVEPNLFLQNSVAEVYNLAPNTPRSFEYPYLGALEAKEMAENAEYENVQLPYSQAYASINCQKFGVMTHLSDEVMSQSMWPLLKLSGQACSAAIYRKFESKLFEIFTGVANVVMDNQSATAAMRTSGTAKNQTANGTFGYLDLFKMFGALMSKKMTPSHFLAHPMAWPIFAQEPFLRAQFYHNGQLGAGIWGKAPQFDQQANLPFGLLYVPYANLRYDENTTLTGTFSALPAIGVTDVYLIDKSNSLAMFKRGDIMIDKMDNWYRDATALKVRAYAGFTAKEGGTGISVAKNIRMDLNERAILTMNTVAV
jgi:hypothetical protein